MDLKPEKIELQPRFDSREKTFDHHEHDPYSKYLPPRLQTETLTPQLQPQPEVHTEPDAADLIPTSVGPAPDAMWETVQAELEAVRETRRKHPSYNPVTGRIEIKSVSHMHEAIMNWMLLNPSLPMKYCSEEFGVTQAWLSVLKNSGLFKARLAEKQALIDKEMVQTVTTLEEKIHAVADIGIEKLADMLEATKDPKLVLDATDKLLSRLGYGAKLQANGLKPGTIVEQNNFYVASSQELSEARKKIRSMGPVVEVPDTDRDKDRDRLKLAPDYTKGSHPESDTK